MEDLEKLKSDREELFVILKNQDRVKDPAAKRTAEAIRNINRKIEQIKSGSPYTPTAVESLKGEFDAPLFQTKQQKQKAVDEKAKQLSDDYIKNLKEYRGGMGGMVQVLLFPDPRERGAMLKDEGFDVDMSNPQYPVLTLNTPKGPRRYALNKPGFSLQDAVAIAGDIGTFAPAGKLASAGKNWARRLGRAFVSGSTVSTIRESIQASEGGTFNPEQIVFDAVAEMGGSALADIGAKWWRSLNPTAKKKAADTRSIQTLIDEFGLPLEDILKTVKSRFGEEIPEGSEIVSTRLLENAAKQNPQLALNLLNTNAKIATDVNSSLARMMDALSGRDIRPDMLDSTFLNIYSIAQSDAKSLAKVNFTDPMSVIGKQYEKLYEELPRVEVAGARDYLREVIKAANPGSQTQMRAKSWLALLSNPDQKANKIYLDEAGKILDITYKPAKLVHSALKEIQTYVGDYKDKSIANEVRNLGKKVSEELTESLDAASNGKFSKINEEYARASKAFDKWKKSTIAGELYKPGKKKTNIDVFLKNLFEVEPGQDALRKSKEFLSEIQSVSPQSANDIYGSYFAVKTSTLPEGANSAEMLDHIFKIGPKGDITKTSIYQLAPNTGVQQRVKNLGEILKAGAKLPDSKTLEASVDSWMNKKLDPDVAHYVYLRLAISRAIASNSEKKILENLVNSSIDPRNKADWESLLQSREALRISEDKLFTDRIKAGNTALQNMMARFDRMYKRTQNGKATGTIAGSVLRDLEQDQSRVQTEGVKFDTAPRRMMSGPRLPADSSTLDLLINKL